MAETCMTAEALEALLHRRQPAAQARVLKSWGVPFKRRPDGTLAVSPAAADAALTGKREASNDGGDNGLNWATA